MLGGGPFNLQGKYLNVSHTPNYRLKLLKGDH